MNWDQYFLKVCNTVASNSKCLSRKIGAIIVEDKSIISTGYNGPPRGVPHCGKERFETDDMYIKHNLYKKVSTVCPRQLMGFKSGEGLEWCIAGHAERNSLINAARSGVSTKDAKMYMNCPVPCTLCLIEIINAGIEEIIFTEWIFYDKMGEWLLNNSELKARTYEIE